ncbi:hypothetical protein SAMN04488587_0619 [Methanococcoides vulcani]|uniref:Uncharacterized protein n=1 Tax=Methanococcoides vulcani TaxID=1353158 RepID=A0A1H9YJS3_9EURY|nr:hypothetical protein SAMN04488587_0619 [Methanococcoides vulcani]
MDVTVNGRMFNVGGVGEVQILPPAQHVGDIYKEKYGNGVLHIIRTIEYAL